MRSIIVARAGFVGALAAALLGGPAIAAAQESGGDKPAKIEAAAKPEKPAITLKAGDKAPALSVAKWVKGSEVKAFEPGKTYVVEFWATWCGPCIQSMPHLSELQRSYKSKGVTIIGVTSEDPRNSLAQVEKMVSEKGDGMGYTVAWDTERKTNEAFMAASGQRGIPTSFVIDGTGTLVWIGHPMFLDTPLEIAASGKWDAKTSPAVVEKAQKEAEDLMQGAFEKLRSNMPKDALANWEKLEAKFPAVASTMSDMKFQLLLAAGEYERAYKIASDRIDNAIAKKDGATLNAVAWSIVDPESKIDKRDLALAMKAATKADEFTEGKDPAILDTLARVYFLKGETAKAIELQNKAIENAKGGMKTDLEKTLAEYKNKTEKKE